MVNRTPTVGEALTENLPSDEVPTEEEAADTKLPGDDVYDDAKDPYGDGATSRTVDGGHGGTGTGTPRGSGQGNGGIRGGSGGHTGGGKGGGTSSVGQGNGHLVRQAEARRVVRLEVMTLSHTLLVLRRNEQSPLSKSQSNAVLFQISQFSLKYCSKPSPD